MIVQILVPVEKAAGSVMLVLVVAEVVMITIIVMMIMMRGHGGINNIDIQLIIRFIYNL